MTTKPIRAEIRAAQRALDEAIGQQDWEQVREARQALERAETATHVAQTAHDQTVRRYEASLKNARAVAVKAGLPGAELDALLAEEAAE